MSAIEISGATKRFDATPVLTGVELTVPAGSITAVLGASGSGKTTLLRLIAGFERLDAGTLRIGGRVIDDGHRTIVPQHRGTGYVPQEGALFPHLNVSGNIGFGLRRRDRSTVDHLLELTGLTELRGRYPHQLSGGQQQRVALARALAIGPEVILLDEPFSALDASLRAELRRDVARILDETGTTTILVTHDQDEALALADQIAVLSGGRMLAAAEPRELYRDPPDAFTATALGEANIIAAEICEGRATCSLGSVPVQCDGAPTPDGPARLLLRPEQLLLHLKPTVDGTHAVVQELQYEGHDALARLGLDDPAAGPLLARVPGDRDVSVGEDVWLVIVGPGRAWPSRE